MKDQEGRKARPTRYSIAWTVLVEPMEAREKSWPQDEELKSVNLSANGLLIRIASRISLRESMAFSVRVIAPDFDEAEPLIARKGRLVRTQEAEDGGAILAISFDEPVSETEICRLLSIRRANRVDLPEDERCTLRNLQDRFSPKLSIDEIFENVWEAIEKEQDLLGYSVCTLWYYEPANDALLPKSGTEMGESIRFSTDSYDYGAFRRKLMDDSPVLLNSRSLAHDCDIPFAFRSARENWLIPLGSRGEFLGVMHIGFNEDAIELEHGRVGWFCYSLSNFLSQCLERWSSAHDHRIRINLINDLPTLTENNRIDGVYDRVLENLSDIANCSSGSLWLFDGNQRVYVLSAVLAPRGPMTTTFYYEADQDPCFATPESLAERVQLIDAPRSHAMVEGDASAKLLRILLRNPNRDADCIGMVCLTANPELILEGRLKRRLELVSAALTTLLESALHRVIRLNVQAIIKKQRSLAIKGADAIARELAKSIQGLMGAEACSLFLTAPGASQLTLEATTLSDLSDAEMERSYDVSNKKHLTSTVARDKRTLAIPDPDRWHDRHGSEPLIRDVKKGTARSFLGAPLFRQGDALLGVVRCANKRGASSLAQMVVHFNRHDIEILDAVAQSIAPLIIASNDEKNMSNSLCTAGHEIIAAASIIASRSASLQKDSDWFRTVFQRKGLMNSASVERFTSMNYRIKGLRDTAELINLFQNDIAIAQSQEHVSWEPISSNIYGDVIAQVCDMLRERASAKGIEIDYDDPKTLPTDFFLDRNRMKQVFYNLVFNAIKYNRQRSKTIYSLSPDESVTIDKSKIMIRSRFRGRNECFVSVISDGFKIFEDEKDKIFDYGFRGREARSRKQGLGIGMHVCRRIAESTEGVSLELTRLYDPVVFTVRLTGKVVGEH